jgi:hypothetical protein
MARAQLNSVRVRNQEALDRLQRLVSLVSLHGWRVTGAERTDRPTMGSVTELALEQLEARVLAVIRKAR